ncbi:MAG: class I SAM-dependent methyltransferase, partial [Patescibacteria group bacterium]
MQTDLIRKLYHHPIFSQIFHTVLCEIQTELKDCQTVLDLGCGPSSPLEYCSNIKYSVGVEPFAKYIKMSKKKLIHTRYINKKIENLDFKEKSFDAVLMIEVLEHVDKKTGQ